MPLVSNIFTGIPRELPEELLEVLVSSDSVRIERIVSRNHASPESGWYDQAQDEWVILLRGEATIAYDSGEEIELLAGDYLTIPAHQKHRVKRTAPDQDTVWLTVHY